MVVLIPVRWQLIFDLDDVDDTIFGPFLGFVLMETLETLDISSEALEAEPTPTLEAEQSKFQAGTWRFSGLVQGTEWDPSIFTRVLENCAPKFGETLKLASIFSYACRDQSIAVPPNCVAVEGYLKMKGSTVVRRGTLERRLQHPDLQIEWHPCNVGRCGRYTDHDFIARFHRETALPPAGVLQRSADAVGPRLRVDFLGPSDAPLNRGGWAARRARKAPADEGATGAGAPAVWRPCQT